MIRGKPRFLKPAGFENEEATSKSAAESVVRDYETSTTAGGDDSGAHPSISANPYASLSIQQQRIRLPIFKNRNHILYLLEKYRCLVIVGETGSGKSTQVPQYLLESGWSEDSRLIGVTQPRRVAAVTLAARVAEERMSVLGREVGYVVRFDDCTNETTRIKYMTDGILIREIMSDPLLTKYSIIMVDEAHERSIATDIVCGLLRKILVKRKDLRVIVSSATVDAEVFRNYFNLNETDDKSKDTSTAISVEGRMYPINVLYAKTPLPDYVKATVTSVMSIHKNQSHGDILAFLTGQDEVEAVCQLLRDQIKRMRNVDRLWILPMYGALPAKEQFKVFDSTPAGTRKVVVATNVAETSVTIPGIVYESLMVVPVSQASAQQRAGRAGRLKPGICYRLYPESEYSKLLPSTVAEVQRSSMAPVILQLKALGIDNVLRFHYLARPPAKSMLDGVQLLYALGALDSSGRLTDPLGTHMAECPLPPMHAKALLASGTFECSEEMVTIIAMLQIQDVFIFPTGAKHKAEVSKRKFSVEEGDHVTLLNVFLNFELARRSSRWCSDNFLNYRALCRAVHVRNQLLRILRRAKVPMVSCKGRIEELERLGKCLVSGLFCNAAKLHHTGVYRTLKEDCPFSVYKGSSLLYRKHLPKWVVYNDVQQSSIRDLISIDSEWLYELAPHYYEFGTDSERALPPKRPRSNSPDPEGL